MRDSYTYIDDDAVTITHPANMGPIRAIHALRTGNASHFLNSDPSRSHVPMGSNSHTRHAVDRMIHQGWKRSRNGFETLKRKIWRQNDEMASKLLGL